MCNQCVTPNIGPSEDNQFAERLLGVMNDASLGLMISIGHRTGLFDTMATMPPSTSEQIAQQADLNERYVREWLGAMVTGKIVTFTPDDGQYSLPAAHAKFLTRAGGENIAVSTQFLAVLGGVEDNIVQCFREGGGVPYDEFPRFHEVMEEESNQSVLSLVESTILPLAPGLVKRLEQGIRALDVGCGRGRVFLQLAESFPNSSFVGIDLSPETIAFAQNKAAEKGLTNIEFRVQDASDFDETAEENAFDFVTTFDSVHDQAKPANVLRGIRRTLKPDGVYLMQDINGTSHVDQDIDHPLGTLLYTISCMHCMTVSLAQGGEGLGAMWGEEKTREYLSAAGFESITTHRLEHDIMNNWYVMV